MYNTTEVQDSKWWFKCGRGRKIRYACIFILGINLKHNSFQELFVLLLQELWFKLPQNKSPRRHKLSRLPVGRRDWKLKLSRDNTISDDSVGVMTSLSVVDSVDMILIAYPPSSSAEALNFERLRRPNQLPALSKDAATSGLQSIRLK